MKSNPDKNQGWLSANGAAIAMIAAAVALRFWILLPTGLWEDEIIAATHAMQPFWGVLIDSVRNDVHPPLYFLQLHFWALLGHSDIWLILNSVAWSIAAIMSMWIVARRLYGAQVARLATVLLAVSPTAVYMADELRMYAMLSTMLIWAFYLTVCVFGLRQRSLKSVGGLLLLLIAIVNTHAIGFLAVLVDGIYALWLIIENSRLRRDAPTWIAVFGAAAIVAVPWLATDMLHDANLPRTGLGLVPWWLAQIMLYSVPFRTLGAIIFLIVASAGLLARRTRAITAIFILSPLALAVVCEAFFKPIFKDNFFATLASPFLALVLAQLLDLLPATRFRTAAIAFGTVLLFGLTIFAHIETRHSTDYRGLAEAIRPQYRPGDVIYVPQPSMFWGMAWYLIGPDWGSTLAIAPEPSAQWKSVYRHLGPALVEKLELMPKTQFAQGRGFTLLVGKDSAGEAKNASRVWLITTPRADLPKGYPPASLNALVRKTSVNDRALTLTLYDEAAAAGKSN